MKLPREQSVHTSVLLDEVLGFVYAPKGGFILDATLGGGGVTEALLKRFGDLVGIVALDADKDAIARAKKMFGKRKNLSFSNTNFSKLDEVLEGQRSISTAIFDLGLSSDQLESSGRGFSFQREEPLHMTFSSVITKETLTAEEILNEWSEGEIETILRILGEERFSRRIAQGIVLAREKNPIKTTKELVDIISHSVPGSYRNGKRHPATKTFQALRIVVNGELTALEEGLKKSFALLSPKGRLIVISFHSLEDRIVKGFMRKKAKEGEAKILTKKVITAGRTELQRNPRSRSAKLRVLEKI